MKLLFKIERWLRLVQPSYLFPCDLKWVYCFLYLFIVSTNSHAQNGYNFTYDEDRGLTFKSIQNRNGYLQVYGDVVLDSEFIWRAFIAKIDTNGSILRFTEISDSTANRNVVIARGIEISECDNGDLIIPFSYLNTSYVNISRFDGNCDPIYFHEFEKTDDIIVAPYSIIEMDNNDILITGWAQRKNYDVDAFVIRATANGEKEWMKYYGVNHVKERGYNISRAGPNEYVIGGKSDTSAYIFAIDTTGKLKWQWRNSDSEHDFYVRGLQKQANGDWVYLSFYDRLTENPEPPNDYHVSTPIFIRRDSIMNLVTYKPIEPLAALHEMYRIIPSNDGGWIAAGTISNVTDEMFVDTNSLFGRIVKLDASGDIVWAVQDTAFWNPKWYSENYLSGITESPAGSIYAVGYANKRDENDIYRSYGWLLKITADGCIDTLCTTTSLLDQLEKLNTKVTVYPNPATDYLIFRIDKELHDVQAEIYDLHGRLIQRQGMQGGVHAVMFEKQMPPGIYIWRVVTREGLPAGSGKVVIE